MKQYTNEIQTAKLIELGFEKPKSIVDKYYDFDAEDYKEVNHYSIGELIEMLPKHIFPNGVCFDLIILSNQNLWVVKYAALFYGEVYRFCSKDLVDALYDMIIKLKEEGVI